MTISCPFLVAFYCFSSFYAVRSIDDVAALVKIDFLFIDYAELVFNNCCYCSIIAPLLVLMMCCGGEKFVILAGLAALWLNSETIFRPAPSLPSSIFSSPCSYSSPSSLSSSS